MALISKEEFLDLAQFNNEICVSIFIPTHRGGKEVLEGENQKSLKSQLKDIKVKLTEKGISKERIDLIAEPILQLIDDKRFWRHQSDGLAVFASEGILKKFTLPINFEAHNYIAKEFYLKPLAPAFTGDGRFYLLELQISNVALYEATKYSIGEVKIDDITPDQLEDRVGYDYEEKNSKHKTQRNNIGANADGTSTQHGYDAANRDRKNEFLRYFRAVDKGLDTILHDENVPLVVACQDYLFPIYQEANSYKNLYDKCIPGNPADYRNMFELHAKAVEELEPFFTKEKDQKIKTFNELPPERTSTRVTDILPSIFEGKVDTLFLENREDLFGTFDENNMSVDVHNERREDSISLMNYAAKKVIEQGGSVYLIESAFMPEKESKMNALLRYNY
ncbi:hypothetical protein LZ575_02195 [Antarcticibacterium sp. 1MA-6-2]|uniref:baeRF7 domain-containing protein n=1 Tax=Antarcticibacterium sp. 1MA-6-2 TaxID=2908210 RepID=UPI001F27BB63|nr:hypothetical protein [Antarcticibacterium sp. 1MA-6-2]UJH91560.1 hypothetical protein LZ575_02195 [Antarcticibacterium sp. 1MA-6-2]